MSNFLTNIDWSSSMVIGIGIVVVVAIIAGLYLWNAWSEKKPPFNR